MVSGMVWYGTNSDIVFLSHWAFFPWWNEQAVPRGK